MPGTSPEHTLGPQRDPNVRHREQSPSAHTTSSSSLQEGRDELFYSSILMGAQECQHPPKSGLISQWCSSQHQHPDPGQLHTLGMAGPRAAMNGVVPTRCFCMQRKGCPRVFTDIKTSSTQRAGLTEGELTPKGKHRATFPNQLWVTKCFQHFSWSANSRSNCNRKTVKRASA